ncbi:MAG TPA: hypothetical protein VGN22_10650 [Pseudonocardia sp.]|jgi:hypothetical protein
MNLLKAVRRLLGHDDLPDGFNGRLDADEQVLATAALGGGGHLVVTSRGLWLPTPDGVRRLGWHLVSKASWKNGAIEYVEAQERDVVDGAVLITDLPPQRLRLAEPGRVPEMVHARVTGSIKSRHHRDLPGGGAWFVQRKVPGRDGIVMQVRADPGTDEAALRQVVGDVARTLKLS